MRKFSLVLVAAMLLFSGNLVANDATKADPTGELTSQIGDLLDNNSFVLEDTDLTAKVKFTLNEDGQIVVLHVDTKDSVLEAFVKARLNYQKVNFDGFREGRMYTVPVRITA